MRAVILASEQAYGKKLASALRRAGFSECAVTFRIEQAEAAQREGDACCIVFDRGFAPFGYSAFYRRFSNPRVWFVPVAPAPDAEDVVHAATDHRMAYWLSREAEWSDIREMTDCLIGRLLTSVTKVPTDWLPDRRVLSRYGYRSVVVE